MAGGEKEKNRRPHSLKSEKRKNRAGVKNTKTAKPPAQASEPFEQDGKRRIGQHSDTGEPLLMKK
jgi:hypothetical protein